MELTKTTEKRTCIRLELRKPGAKAGQFVEIDEVSVHCFP